MGLLFFIEDYLNNDTCYVKPLTSPDRYITAELKAKLIVNIINYLSFELGYPKEELVKYIKQGIEWGKI